MESSILKLMKQYKLPHWLPVAVLACGALLRLVGLTVSPIWYDEAYTIYLARFPTLMTQIEYSDFNPPLWQLVVTPFIALLGESEFSLRLPALVFSLAAMWLAWQIASNVLPSLPGIQLSSAVLIALLPYHFWLAQDGRPYALFCLLYLAVIWFGMHNRWLGFGACLGLMFYTHSTGLFYGAAAGLGMLVLQPSKWRQIMLAGLLAGLAMLPWLPTYFSRVGDHWLGALTINELMKALYFATWAGALPPIWAYGAIWVLFISLGLALVITFLRWNDRQHLALAVFTMGPLVMLLLVAIYRNLVFYRPLSAMLLPMAIWLPASLWPRSPAQWKWGGWVLPYFWGLLLVVGLLSWSPAIKGGELRQVAEMINEQWQPGDVIYHATGTSWAPAQLYLQHHGYVINEQQHDGLLQTELQNLFGAQQAGLEDLEYKRAWVFWAKDVIMSPAAWARMQKYTAGATLVGTIHYWQAADIDVYLSYR